MTEYEVVAVSNDKVTVRGEGTFGVSELSKVTGVIDIKGFPFWVYTGKYLDDYVSKLLNGILHERDFVGQLRHQVSGGAWGKLYGVSGLRGTGKTVGAMQLIRGYDGRAAYVLVNEGATVTDLLRLLNGLTCDLVVVDEITNVRDFATDGQMLADVCAVEKRIVVTGTLSYALSRAVWLGLNHRLWLINVTHVGYPEMNRLFGVDVWGYISHGGMGTGDDGERFLSDVVLRNLLGTLENNRGVGFSVEGERLAGCLYTVIYYIIVGHMKARSVFFSYLLGFFHGDVRGMVSAVLNELGMSAYEYERYELNAVAEFLVDVDVMVRVKNYANAGDVRYYLTIPALFCLLNERVITVLSRVASGGVVDMRGKRGYLFEAVVMSAVARELAPGQAMFWRDGDDEVDIVLDDGCGGVYAYEVKSTDDARKAVEKSSGLHKIKADGYGVIYGGNMELVVDGIKCIPAEKVLRNVFSLFPHTGVG